MILKNISLNLKLINLGKSKMIFNKKDIEYAFDNTFSLFPEIKKEDVVLTFGGPRIAKASMLDTHRSYTIDLCYTILFGVFKIGIVTIGSYAFNILFGMWQATMFFIVMSLAVIWLTFEDSYWLRKPYKEHKDKYVILFHEKIKTNDLGKLMAHEFAHILFRLEKKKYFWNFSEEDKCWEISKKRIGEENGNKHIVPKK